ncbi:hypothetical protein [Sphingomonas sp. HMP6]|uniref:hypothetical protein n=1 Tax=Sphingomonas sp. HMP6 TaxID=1517551 RepID=UPI0015970A52|nr:hypothetical protein [Sphingomonas sp. HMP6]BCA60701.1 hypothetical protein HMP06_3470 [Sphingomonas sp. HMP6]
MNRTRFKSRPSPIIAAAALAALGLSNLSPVQIAATGAVLGFGVMATPALAAANIPGVGLVVKKKPGNAPIVAPSDNNGIVRFAGLEPGEYEVSLIDGSRPVAVKVGADGILTARAQASDDGKDRWAETILGGGGKPKDLCRPLTEMCPYLFVALKQTVSFDVKALFGSDGLLVAVPGRGPVRADPVAPKMRFIDVNASSSADIARLAPTTTPDAAQLIVAERTKGGAFKDPIDFAHRVCPKVSVDFDLTPTRIGPAQIIAKSGDPKTNGFKCAPPRAGEVPTLELYGRKHNYVGHVTLLR